MSILLRRTIAALLPPLGMGAALLSLVWSPPAFRGRCVVEIRAPEPGSSAAPSLQPTPEILWTEQGREALRALLDRPAPAPAAAARGVDPLLAALRWRKLDTPSLFELTFESLDAAWAAEGASVAASALERIFAGGAGESDPLRSQRRAVESEIGALQAEAQADPGLIQERRRATARSLTDLAEQYARARSARLELEARWNALQHPVSAPPEWADSPELSALREERARLEQRRDQLAVRYGPQWPEMKEIAGQLEVIEIRLGEEARRVGEQAQHAAETDYRQALAQERALEQALSSQKRERLTLEEREAHQIRRQERLAELEEERGSLAVRLGAGEGSSLPPARARVVAATPSPAPRRSLPASSRLALGGLAGLLLAVILLQLWDRLDPALTSAAEAERALDATLLAVLPEVPGGLPPGLLRLESAPPAGTEGPVEPLAAAARGFRDLRTGLLLTRGGDPARVLLVTACRRGEGKTTVAAHVALALARRGVRVLLIDAHLRRPRAHRLFDLPAGPGLVDALAGTVELEEAMRATNEPGLSMMPAGDVNGGGGSLLDAGSLRHLRDRLLQSGRFQHLVIDAGEVGSLAPPERLAVACSGVLLVVRTGRNVRGAVRRAAATLRRHGAAYLAGVWIGPETRIPFLARPHDAPAPPSVRSAEPAPVEVGAGATSAELNSEVMHRLEKLRERLGGPRRV